MNNTHHTPGPWRVVHASAHEFNPETNRRDIIGKNEFGDAYVAGDISQADARLIAAAPDLLSALEKLAVWNDDQPCFCHVHGDSERARYTPHDSYCDNARAALAKAKGAA